MPETISASAPGSASLVAGTVMSIWYKAKQRHRCIRVVFEVNHDISVARLVEQRSASPVPHPKRIVYGAHCWYTGIGNMAPMFMLVPWRIWKRKYRLSLTKGK